MSSGTPKTKLEERIKLSVHGICPVGQFNFFSAVSAFVVTFIFTSLLLFFCKSYVLYFGNITDIAVRLDVFVMILVLAHLSCTENLALKCFLVLH